MLSDSEDSDLWKEGLKVKRIICFGDSNTWGYDPQTGSRYDEETRWPMVMQKLLGDDYQIIEEGQNGRTIASEDPWEWGNKKGMDYALPMVESHHPFDLLIIMLGSNDMKAKFHLPAGDIAGGLQNMLMQIRGFMKYKCGAEPKILVVSPVYLGENLEESPLAEFVEGKVSIEKSKQVAKWFKLVADQFGCAFIDASEFASPSLVDAMHLSAEGHRLLAKALTEKVKEIIG